MHPKHIFSEIHNTNYFSTQRPTEALYLTVNKKLRHSYNQFGIRVVSKKNGTWYNIEILTNKIFPNWLQNLSHKLPFWDVKRAKKTGIQNYVLALFPPSKLSVHYFLGWHLGHTAEKGMTRLWHDHLKTYFTELIQLKYKLILWIKTMGSCGLPCVVWLKCCEFSKRKSVSIVGNSSMMCMTEIFEFNLPVNFLNFLSNWANFLDISISCEKLRAFKRNPSLWSSCLMPWRSIVQL